MTTQPRRRTAIVTGAAQGIGAAEAKHLVATGRRVVLNDIDADLLARTAAALGGPDRAVPVAGDIAASETSESLIAAATSDGAELDTVVSNAAALCTGMIFDQSDRDWAGVVEVTLGGTFRLSRAAAIHWRDTPLPRGGRRNLVLTSSRAALLANPGQTAYAAAKAGVTVMAQTLARELKPHGVQVNALAPRAYTKMMRDGVGEFAQSALEEWSPEHIGRFVAFLAGPQAAGISGQVFIVHGPRVRLVRTWQVGEPVEFDFAGEPPDVGVAVDRLFGQEPRAIADFMVDDLPLADPSAVSPFAVDDATAR
ncbi:SDR family NAD(P)-dependent oxidoreductase [Nocardia jinanensis]|uniref:3-oxoacyl-ACP reductase n=1 Tax=Nocardia jinanensis TaxID=382504 RepID=A0A917VYS6_9NOCA|nr:SDR family NAD(P)-dependent oxidoreductase [Nocardia jinanensis]GGL40195.1 3-oxoacyl-ACP reductase [Nocardia jinanensis]